MILHILRPEAEDYNKLTEICQNAKKRWGYPDYLIDLWKDELTVTPRYIRNNNLLKAQDESGEIFGFGSILNGNGSGIYEIKHLWISPDCSNKFVGKLLLENLEKKASDKTKIKVVADPNMIQFYQQHGYHKVGEVISKPDGGKLPVLKKIIRRTEDN
jgi:ribosomal protein S18 acetylase RimI-like enzyme